MKTSQVSGVQAVNMLINTEIGTPLRVKISNYSDFEQVIFCGIQNVQYSEAFVFLNGQGATGTFALSANFIKNNCKKVKFDFENNNPEEVAYLLSLMQH